MPPAPMAASIRYGPREAPMTSGMGRSRVAALEYTVIRMIRHDWTASEIREIYNTPLLGLLFRAQQVARGFHRPDQVQTCHLVSIKTGGCPEDCAYCPQS